MNVGSAKVTSVFWETWPVLGMCRKVLPRLTADEQAAAKLELENTQALALL